MSKIKVNKHTPLKVFGGTDRRVVITPEVRNNIISKWNSGCSLMGIAKELGVAYTTVYRATHKSYHETSKAINRLCSKRRYHLDVESGRRRSRLVREKYKEYRVSEMKRLGLL